MNAATDRAVARLVAATETAARALYAKATTPNELEAAVECFHALGFLTNTLVAEQAEKDAKLPTLKPITVKPRKRKTTDSRDCPECEGEGTMEYFPDDWEGDPSEGSRLMHKLPAHWCCGECGHNERDEPHDRADDNESDHMDRMAEKRAERAERA